MREKLTLSRIDYLGAYVSLACAIHCALTPILVVLIPFFALGFFENESVHRTMVVVSVLLGLASFFWGVRRHGVWRLLLLIGSGIGLLVWSQWSQNPHAEIYASFGGLFLAIGHLINRRLCQKCIYCNGKSQ